MKHLILDTNVVLALWLGRAEYKVIEELVDEAKRRDVIMWIAASTLPTIDCLMRKYLKDRGMSADQCEGVMASLMASLSKMVSVCSNFGYSQFDTFKKAKDFEEAQIATAAESIHGEKVIVTLDKGFDSLGIIDTMSPADALAWIKQGESSRHSNAFIDLKAQQDVIRPQLENNIHKVLQHGSYILGPEVKELEERLCNFTGAKHCIGVSSGTDALLMPLMAWGIGPGDAVFTSPFTFIATAEVIQLLGATPVFVDIDPRTFNIDPAKLELAIKALEKNDPSIHPLPRGCPLNPKVIIPVDLFGLPADYDPITALAEKHGLKVLSDSAQGFGSEYKGKKSGTFGHVTATSFFPAKPLGGYGDGGAIFTNDEQLATELESIRVHGKGTDKYDNIRIGLNARLDTIQAAVLLAKLDIFDQELEKKQAVAERYTQFIDEGASGLTPPFVPQGLKSAWAQYSVLAEDDVQRGNIQTALRNAGIPSMVYYPKPLHLQTAFSGLGYKLGDFSISEDISERIFSLPMHGYLSNDLIDNIKEVC